MSEPSVDDVVAAYVRFRDKKKAIEDKAKEEVDKLKEKMSKLEGWLMEKADKDGVVSFRTPHGTAFVTTTDYAGVADWDAVLEFIRDHEAYDMLERRVNKSAVRAYIDNTKAVPPGVNYGTRVGINIRRAKGGDE